MGKLLDTFQPINLSGAVNPGLLKAIAEDF